MPVWYRMSKRLREEVNPSHHYIFDVAPTERKQTLLLVKKKLSLLLAEKTHSHKIDILFLAVCHGQVNSALQQEKRNTSILFAFTQETNTMRRPSTGSSNLRNNSFASPLSPTPEHSQKSSSSRSSSISSISSATIPIPNISAAKSDKLLKMVKSLYSDDSSQGSKEDGSVSSTSSLRFCRRNKSAASPIHLPQPPRRSKSASY